MPSFDPFEEGDALTAANVNSRFTTMRTWVNDLPEESVERWALTDSHVPGQTFGPGQATELFTNGFIATGAAETTGAAGVAFDTYENSLPYSSGPAHPYNYQAFSSSGGNAPYGPSSSDSGGGWRIPGKGASGTTPMELDFGAAITPSDYDIWGIIVRGWVEVHTGSDIAAETDEEAGLIQSVVLGLGFEDGLGARYVVERSVRWNTYRGVTRGLIATSTLLQTTELAEGDGQVRKVFGVVASQDWADTALTSPPTERSLDIRHYCINIIPIRALDV